MATTTEQLTDAIDAMRELVAKFDGKNDAIDDALAAAVQQVVLTHKTFYVDAVAGSDAAAGDVDNPLATIQEAIDRTPDNASCLIRLLEDITLPASLMSITRKNVTINGGYAPSGKAVITLQAFEDDTHAMLSGFVAEGAMPSLALSHCELVFPTYVGALPEHPRYAALMSHIQSMNKGLECILLTNVDLTFPAADGFGYIGSLSYSAILFMTTTLTDTNSNMSGRYIRGANAADPSTDPTLITNMATL